MKNECIVIDRVKGAQNCGNDWNGQFWHNVSVTNIDKVHPQSSHHRPMVEAKLVYDETGLAVCFRVEDRYVICRNMEFMSYVCQDSCVEFFFQPGGADGYFNFEVNCGGAMLAGYIRDPARTANGFKDWTALMWDDARQVKIYPSHPGVIEKEITSPIEWRLAMFIPFVVLEQYCGQSAYDKEEWSGNLYKCADKCSHPHWASWQAVEPLNFHQPKFFGSIRFA